MVAVAEEQIEGFVSGERGQVLVEPVGEQGGVRAQLLAGPGPGVGFPRQGRHLRVPLHGVQAGAGIGAVEVKGGDAGVAAKLEDAVGTQPERQAKEQASAAIVDGVGRHEGADAALGVAGGFTGCAQFL